LSQKFKTKLKFNRQFNYQKTGKAKNYTAKQMTNIGEPISDSLFDSHAEFKAKSFVTSNISDVVRKVEESSASKNFIRSAIPN
jgi:hypothetical protein